MKKFALFLMILIVYPIFTFQIAQAVAPTAMCQSVGLACSAGLGQSCCSGLTCDSATSKCIQANTALQIPCPLAPELCDLGNFISSATKIVAPAAALILLLMLVYAGFLKMTAAGDAEKEKQAMKIIQAAITGFVIIVLAVIIVASLGGFFSLPTLIS